MSVVFTSCIDCSTSNLSLEDLLRKAFVCDNEGNAYIRTYSSNAGSSQYCGLIEDYTIETRTINGESHDGIEVVHSLNKTTGIFLAVTDENGTTVTASAQIIDGNTIFIMLDGLIEGAFCVS